MTKALSVDLRKRVIGAIEEGASCRQAAVRFGVSASSAIRWHALSRTAGNATPKQQGGDRRSGRIEAHAAAILGALERKSDITLADLRAELAGHGIGVSIAGLWRFFKRRRITLKKRPGMPQSRIVPTS
jgi:transposase|tara:strand:- start:336 stop:722 length:387 start_codon:yes stop_codon:yes gene_type:complete